MKNIMMIMLLILGASSIQAQGHLGKTKEEILLFADDYSGEKPKVEEKTSSTGADVILISYEDYSIRFVFNENSLVEHSAWYPWTDIEFASVIENFNDNYIQMKGDTWHNYFDGGVVIMRMHVIPEEDRKEGDRYLPYFTFDYELY